MIMELFSPATEARRDAFALMKRALRHGHSRAANSSGIEEDAKP